MTAAVCHLPGIEATSVHTQRLRTHVLLSGPPHGKPVLLLHGNLASSTFWEETMLALPKAYRAAAPDLRGYGLTDPAAQIDATRGVADWVDDAVALADQFGWDRFHIVAHSLGGCVAWALTGMHAPRILSTTLIAPGPPCGFGGARGERGRLIHPDGAGSGAGLALPPLVQRLAVGERGDVAELTSPRGVMNRLYWKPPFRPQREEDLLTAMLQIHVGERQFPGDARPSPHWPGFAPGSHGPLNAISPLYNQWVLPQFVDAPAKPRLLWIHGAEDAVICDHAASDAATQGQLGLRAGWPGAETFPPQPMLAQTAHAVDEYARRGGHVTRVMLPDCGHTPYLERPAAFQQALAAHLASRH